MSRSMRWAGSLILLAVGVLLPLLFPSPSLSNIAVFTVIYMTMAVGWNLIGGYTGYISLGHAGFFGLGAYALALMCQSWHVPAGAGPFLLIPVAALVATAFSIPIGYLSLRYRKHTFVVMTIAFIFILQLLAYNLTGITNGSAGLGIPYLPLQGNAYNLPFYYVGLAILTVTLLVSWWVRHSKFGLGLLAIRDDEDRAQGLGVRTWGFKLTAFALSAFFVAMAGALFAYYVTYIYPSSMFDPNNDVAMALMAFLGGLGTVWGPVIGALVVIPIQQYLAFNYSQLYLIIYGALFLVAILLMPRGILPTVSDWIRRMRRSGAGSLHQAGPADVHVGKEAAHGAD